MIRKLVFGVSTLVALGAASAASAQHLGAASAASAQHTHIGQPGLPAGPAGLASGLPVRSPDVPFMTHTRVGPPRLPGRVPARPVSGLPGRVPGVPIGTITQIGQPVVTPGGLRNPSPADDAIHEIIHNVWKLPGSGDLNVLPVLRVAPTAGPLGLRR